MSDTAKRLAEIRARVDAASPGPWEKYEKDLVRDAGDVYGLVSLTFADAREKNADFIAAARTDVPWLLDECERLRSTVALGIKEELERLRDLDAAEPHNKS